MEKLKIKIIRIKEAKEGEIRNLGFQKNRMRGTYDYENEIDPTIIENILETELTEEQYKAIKKAVLEVF